MLLIHRISFPLHWLSSFLLRLLLLISFSIVAPSWLLILSELDRWVSRLFLFFHGITNDYNIFLRNFVISYLVLIRFESLLTLLPNSKIGVISITVSIFVFARRFVFFILIFATLLMDFIVFLFFLILNSIDNSVS